ncbi:MAG: MarR family winged helix-turn-helix transcriptional regulator [Promethearchaeota archaeon]|jgi:DNA-binding MarR family transcriptional regulator
MVDLREGGFLISKIQKLSSRIFAKLLREFKAIEINPAQGRVMFPLWLQDNLSFQELLKKTSLSKATLSHLLDNLEEVGHIKRVRSEEDKRTLNITLTKKNKTLQDKYLEVSNIMTELFYNGFTEKEIDQFEDYLRRLLENLENSDAKRK